MLASYRFELWLTAPTSQNFQAFRQADAAARQLDPQSSTLQLMSGRWYRTIFQRTKQPEDLQHALAALQRAVELYPNDAERRAELAQTLAMQGDMVAAQEQAAEALRLDDITVAAGHRDRVLSNALRQSAGRLLGAAR